MNRKRCEWSEFLRLIYVMSKYWTHKNVPTNCSSHLHILQTEMNLHRQNPINSFIWLGEYFPHATANVLTTQTPWRDIWSLVKLKKNSVSIGRRLKYPTWHDLSTLPKILLQITQRHVKKTVIRWSFRNAREAVHFASQMMNSSCDRRRNYSSFSS